MDNKLQDKCNNQTKITDVKSLEQIWLGVVDAFQEKDYFLFAMIRIKSMDKPTTHMAMINTRTRKIIIS